jgi:Flp pilus assembly pilin Flp
MFKLTKMKKQRKRSSRGQGITEYAAMLAFVAILVALTFSVTNGKLSCALSAAFSAVSGQLNNLAKESGASS